MTLIDSSGLPIGHFNTEHIRIYRKMARRVEGGVIVEMGTLYGRSLASIVDICKRKHTELWAIDTWKLPHPKYHSDDPYRTFVENMVELGHWGKFKIIKGDSANSATKFKDGSVDLGFIDANHTYKGCYRDIAAWWSKIKVGGTLAGHDYLKSHAGVPKAVDEFFGKPDPVRAGIWRVRKTDERARSTDRGRLAV